MTYTAEYNTWVSKQEEPENAIPKQGSGFMKKVKRIEYPVERLELLTDAERDEWNERMIRQYEQQWGGEGAESEDEIHTEQGF